MTDKKDAMVNTNRLHAYIHGTVLTTTLADNISIIKLPTLLIIAARAVY